MSENLYESFLNSRVVVKREQDVRENEQSAINVCVGLDENPPQFTSTPNTSSLEEVNPYASSTPLRAEVSCITFSYSRYDAGHLGGGSGRPCLPNETFFSGH